MSDRKRSLPSDGMSRTSMLENVHGVERRVEQPQKKMKRLSEDLQNGTRVKTSYAHQGNGIIGEYMRPNSESAEHDQPNLPRAVDLTAGKWGNPFNMIPRRGGMQAPRVHQDSGIVTYHLMLDV